MLSFQRKYFIYAVLLFIIEVFIALYIRDEILRPYGGDFLVVIFMYCSLRSFLNLPPIQIALPVLLFSYIIEFTQYYGLIYKLGLQDSLVAHLILGSTFKWLDMVAYTLGIACVMLIEERSNRTEKDSFS